MTFPKPPEKIVPFDGGAVASHDIGRQFDEHRRSTTALIEFLRKVVRDDGKLRNGLIDIEQLSPELSAKIADAAMAKVESLLSEAKAASALTAGAVHTTREAQADTRKTANAVRLEMANALSETQRVITEIGLQSAEVQLRFKELAAEAERLASAREPTEPVGVLGPNAGGFFAGDKAGATATSMDYAQVSIAWAEYLNGNSVIPADILAISGQGGNAVTGDHWSSRWWAHHAAEAVGGQLAYLYLGPYPGINGPAPPFQAPGGGPIPIGGIYYNTDTDTMYVWTGTTWVPFGTPTKAATFSLFYDATAGQTVFTTSNADMFAASHILDPSGGEGIEVYFNGVRLTPTLDYAVDPVASTITLVNPAPAGSVVGIDILTDPKLLAPLLALTAKLLPLAFDGTTTQFPLQGASATVVVPIADASALLVIIDGVQQEPGIDFTLNTTGDNIIFAEAPAADAKQFIIAFIRSGAGFLTRVEHDNTLTGDGTTILPLGVVNATANAAQRGAVYVPGLADTPANALTINALNGKLGMTVAVQPQIQAGTDNIQPVTPLTLRGVMGGPVSSLTTVQKTVVPAINELRAGQLYKGVWQVAANSPNLTPPLVPPALVGYTWTAETANVNVPEIAPAGITGIAGQSIRSGDRIVWNGAAYQDVSASYVLRAGDIMTGELQIPIGPPSANNVAANKLYVDQAIANNALYRGQWQVAANNPDLVAAVGTNLNGWSWIAETVDPLVPEFAPAGMPGIGGQQVDSGDRVVFTSTGNTYQLVKGSSLSIVEGDARYLNTVGDTATGPIILAADPVNPLGAATKQYVDAVDNAKVNRAGDTMTGPLVLPGDPVAPNQAATMNYVDTTTVAVGGDTMTGLLTLSGDPVLPLEAATKQYADLKVAKSGDTMTGQLTLPATAPVGAQDAATKIYVDTAIATGNLYQGQWQVAANLPDLTPPMAPPALNGYSWIAQTVDPNIPEVVPAGLPGISGLTVFNGDTIRWNAGTSQYERFQGSSLTIAQADTLYVKQVGDTMTGPLVLNADPTLPAGAATKNYVDVLTAAKVDKAGDTMTGMLTLPITHPTLPEEAANKDYVDFAVATNSLYQGAYTVTTNTPDLNAVVPLNGYSWITQTADPQVPEPTIVAIPGIPLGTMMDAGWTIKYNGGTAQFELIKGPDISLTTASTLFVDVTGDTMTGELNMATDGTGVTFNGGGRLYKLAGGGMVLQESTGGQQPQIADNNGANRRDIIDTINGDARYLNTAGDTTTGVLNIGAATGLNFITVQAANPGDNSKHIQLYSTAPNIGINVTSGRINYNHNAAGDTHWFRTGNTDQFGIANTITANAWFNPAITIGNVTNGANALVIRSSQNANNAVGGQIEWQASDGRAGAKFYSVQMTTATQYGGHENNLTAYNFCGGFSYQRAWWVSVASPPNFNVGGDCYARGVKLTSDPSLKRDIREVDRSEIAAAFAHLKPIRFKWKRSRMPSKLGHDGFIEIPNDPLSDREQWGFSADDIERANPNLVSVQQRTHHMDSDGQPVENPPTEDVKHYDLAGVLAIAIAKIRELEEKIEELKATRQ